MEHGTRVIVRTPKGVPGNDLSAHFQERRGTVVGREGAMYRVQLDTPVNVPGVGLVRSDLWERAWLHRPSKCRRCKGTGSIRHDLRCPKCNGEGH